VACGLLAIECCPSSLGATEIEESEQKVYIHLIMVLEVGEVPHLGLEANLRPIHLQSPRHGRECLHSLVKCVEL